LLSGVKYSDLVGETACATDTSTVFSEVGQAVLPVVPRARAICPQLITTGSVRQSHPLQGDPCAAGGNIAHAPKRVHAIERCMQEVRAQQGVAFLVIFLIVASSIL
jgi:hypothetical protein